MSALPDARMPWVVTQLDARLFGLNCSVVREMVIMPEARDVPGVPQYMWGVINPRGRVTPLVDLRRRLGVRSSREEAESLCELMEQRAQDHRRWLDELEAPVRDKRNSALTRGPHHCAFGRLYDTFEIDNILVPGSLKRFDALRRRVHAPVAKRAKGQELALILATDSILDPSTHSGILQNPAALKDR